MVNDSFEENEIDELDKIESEEDSSAPRARNRTVMLTPDITGQVRARLQNDTTITESNDGFESALNLGYRGFAASSSNKEQPIENVDSSSSHYSSPASESRYTSSQTPSSFVHQESVSPQRRMEQPVVAKSEEVASGIYYHKDSKIIGFLVSFDDNKNGEIFELRAGRIIVSSSFVQGSNALLIVHESVSPSHAILRISPNGDIQVLDQLSEFGTKIKRYGSEDTEDLSGDKTSLDHGDVIMFGDRTFHLALLAITESTSEEE